MKLSILAAMDTTSKRKITLEGKTILVTGGAGFIGSSLILRLLKSYHAIRIVNIDSLTDYNPVSLKQWRLRQIEEAVSTNEYYFLQEDISNAEIVRNLFQRFRPQIVVNLAAQAGVRYSIDHPDSYIQSNIIGFYNILEACRHLYDNRSEDSYQGVEHLVYASSSSVYGGNEKVPFSTEDNVDHPVSLYAATKKSDELLAHAYSKLYNLPTTGLRFFTVYGPAGRTDMFYFKATDLLRQDKKIQIYNHGNCRRDFTYIDDIVEGIVRVMQGAPARETGKDGLPIPPYSLYNIGGGMPENLLDYITVLQEELVREGVLPADFDFEAHKEFLPMQPGDVPETYADTRPLERDFGFVPHIGIREGLHRFACWYREYYLQL